MPNIASKLIPTFVGPVVDADRIAETTDVKMLTASERSLIATITNKPTIAIFAAAGQSNSAGRAASLLSTNNLSSGYDITRSELPDPRVLTFSSPNAFSLALWNADGAASVYVNKITVASEPLYHPDGAHGMGHAWTIVRDILNSGLPSKKALLVPCAVGGTSMSPSPYPPTTWGAGSNPSSPDNPGSDLYENVITRMKAASAECDRLGLSWYYAGIIWHQGESNQSTSPATFQLYQDTIFNGFRSRLGVADLPIIVGSYIYETLATGNNASNRQVQIDLGRRLTRTAFFYGPGPGYQVDTDINAQHFNADGQRILSNNGVESYYIALANLTGVVPSPPLSVSLQQVGTVLNIWWKRPRCRFTDFSIQYSTDNINWTTLTKPAGAIVTNNIDCGQRDLPAATINGITQGSTYYVRVSTINETGQSDWTVGNLLTVTIPVQVVGVTVGITDQSTIALSWTASARAVTYTVQTSLDNLLWTTNTSGITTLTYTLTALIPSTTYYVRVFATNPAGDGTVSSSITTGTTTLNVLDGYLSGAAQTKVFGYYSVARRLKNAYTGPLIRVRRTSDNTEQDIAQTANKVLDEASLLTFVGAGDGYITKVYDQSGLVADMAQAVVANQPRIALSGVVSKVNGRPAADQTMDALRLLENTTTGLYAAGKTTVYAVLRATSGAAIAMEAASASGNPRYAPIGVGTGGATLNRTIINGASTTIDSSNTATQVAVNTGYHTVGVVDNGTTIAVRQDKVTIETKAYVRSGTFTVNRNCIFGSHNGSGYSGITGYWSEIVEFTDALADADRNAIELNMAAWFST